MPKLVTVHRQESEVEKAQQYVKTHILLPAGLLVALVAWLLARSAMLEKQPEIRPAIRRWKAAWAEHDVVYDRVFQARYTREQLARRLEATRKEAGDAAAELERLRQGISGDHS